MLQLCTPRLIRARSLLTVLLQDECKEDAAEVVDTDEWTKATAALEGGKKVLKEHDKLDDDE
jgi:hypothetical protein